VADGIFYAELNELLTRELAEDGYSGVEVRVTPMRTEIIIKATRTQSVLGKVQVQWVGSAKAGHAGHAWTPLGQLFSWRLLQPHLSWSNWQLSKLGSKVSGGVMAAVPDSYSSGLVIRRREGPPHP
jgi:hypothetical protein